MWIAQGCIRRGSRFGGAIRLVLGPCPELFTAGRVGRTEGPAEV